MKKLFSLLYLLTLSFSFAQVNPVFSMHFVKVEGDLEAFEKVQSLYMQKAAQAAVDDGDISFWGFLKRINFDGVDDEERSNYLFVQTNKDIDQMLNEKNAWWNNASKVLSPEEQELVAALNKTFEWTRDGRHIFTQEVSIAKGMGSYIQFNFATPKNLSGFISENKSLWKNHFNTSMDKMGMVNWGVGRRIAPINKDWSSVVTWDMFDSLENLMKYRIGFELPDSVAKKSKMSTYNPDGWNSGIIFQPIAFTTEK